MSDNLVLRSYDAVFDASEEQAGVINGKPIVFNSRTNLGYFDEVIEVGALDDANLEDIRFCLNHDTSYVYARSRRNNTNSTMQVSTDMDGMKIRATLDIDESPRARDLYTAIKRGDIDKMSFMFSVDEDRWEELETEHPTRHITKIGSVVEVSAVTFPAYEATEINARSREALENARSAVETARQQNAESVDTDSNSSENELNLAKAKFMFRSKI